MGTWSEQRVDVPGCRLVVDVRRGSTGAVVLLHGQLGVAGIMRPFADALLAEAPAATIAIPDLRGRGRSVCADERRYTWARLADDVVAVLDDLAVPFAALVGVSFGAGLAVKVALRHSDRVAGLALVASPYAGDRRGWLPSQVEPIRTALEAAAAVGSSDCFDAVAAEARARWERHAPASISSALLGIGWSQPFADTAELGELSGPVAVAPGRDDLHRPEISLGYLDVIVESERIKDTPADVARWLAHLI